MPKSTGSHNVKIYFSMSIFAVELMSISVLLNNGFSRGQPNLFIFGINKDNDDKSLIPL